MRSNGRIELMEKHWTTDLLDSYEWTPEELARAFAKELPPVGDDVPPLEDRRLSTLFLVNGLTSQMLGYQRQLSRSFEGLMRDIQALLRGSHPSEVLLEADRRIELATVGILAAASKRFQKAFGLGQNLAVDITGRSRLTPGDVEGFLADDLRWNEAFVRNSLMRDVRDQIRTTVGGTGTSAEEQAATLQQFTDATGGRLGMYATRIWGVGHEGFATEIEAAQLMLNWVLTSTHPCKDCPKLEAASPYGPMHPLPTYPGNGDTQCLTNCLCMLEVATPKKVLMTVSQAMAEMIRRPLEDQLKAVAPLAQLPAAVDRLAEVGHADRELLKQAFGEMNERTAGAILEMAQAIAALAGRPVEVHVAPPAVTVTAPEVKVQVVEEKAKPVRMKHTPVRDKKTREILYTVDEPITE